MRSLVFLSTMVAGLTFAPSLVFAQRCPSNAVEASRAV